MQLQLLPQTSKSCRPFMKYPGGKRDLVHVIRGYWHKSRADRLVEPFVGSGAVAYGLAPDRARLGDVNYALVNLHQQVQAGKKLARFLDYGNSAENYYELRSRFNRLLHKPDSDRVELAALFYWLSKHGFNGLIRFNQAGEFNVAYGKYKSVKLESDFSVWENLSSSWEFRNADFREILGECDRGDFIYADPPYDGGFTAYAGTVFTWNDQVELAEMLADQKGAVLASNAATTRILALYERLGFQVRTVDVKRSISCNGDRASAVEMLAYKESKNG